MLLNALLQQECCSSSCPLQLHAALLQQQCCLGALFGCPVWVLELSILETLPGSMDSLGFLRIP